jgi:hypothetical protein
MDLFKRIQDLSAIYDDDGPSAVAPESRPMFNDGGMLVQPSADGSRPGYKGNKTYPFKRPDGKTDYRLGLDEDTGKFFKKIGKEDNIRIITQNEGESIEDFKKRKAERVTKVNDATVGARQYVDNWTKNWFDNNLKKYGINSFNVMMDDLSSAWQLQLESGDVPKGKGSFNLSTSKLKLPNITTLADTKGKPNLIPFKYNDVTFYKNLESTDALKNKTLAQFKKVFYKDQINNNPKLQEDLTKFFDFMSSNKQGQYRKLDGKTIKDFMNTEVSDEVKFLLNPEISGLDKASKKEVFNSYPDFADNYNKYTEDKVRLRAVQAETEALAKVGKKTADQYLKVKADIAKQNEVLGKMSIKDIANNKELLNSVRMVIDPKTGEVSYTNYTVKDPKGKPVLTDLELAEKIKQKAKNKNFFVTEHIGKKSFNKANLAFPNNIQSANYMSNAQLENARRFLSIAENRNTPAAQNLDKTLEEFKLTIRGPEYGDKRIGNKMDIVFDSKTGVSNIVEDQLINEKDQVKLFKKMGYRCNKSSGGAEDVACYLDDAKQTRADLRSSDINVRAKAITKQRNALNVAKKLPEIGKVLRRVGQGTLAGVTGTLKALGFTSPIGYAIEGAVEGGIYDYYRKKGYNHEQSLAETFTPGIVTGRPEGVPWYGGAEKLLEKELIGDPQQNTKVAQYVSALKDQEQFYDAFGRKQLGLQKQRSDITDKASADIQDLYRSGTVSNINRIMNPESMASQAYNTAVERQLGLQDERARDYKAENYAQTEPSEFMQEQKLKDRNKAMLEMFPMYTQEEADNMYKKFKVEKPENFNIDIFNNVMRDQAKMNYFADNFRLEKAGGGIAKMAGDRSGAMTTSMNPDSQGLSYLMNRVKKVQE